MLAVVQIARAQEPPASRIRVRRIRVHIQGVAVVNGAESI
jgi:hypothetical protein